jgi:murein DD-endopeptidase MepM/ murein hydrolase activator NlpD
MKQRNLEKFIQKLRNKYRFVVLNEETLEERASFRLSRSNVAMILSILLLSFSLLVFALVAYTPLKVFIPGYADFDTRQIITEMWFKVDSLEQEVLIRNNYIQNIRRILNDDVEEYSKVPYKPLDSAAHGQNTAEYQKSVEDSLLRLEFEGDENYNVYYQEEEKKRGIFRELAIYPPVSGLITEKFDHNSGHYAVDIVAKPNTGVKAILDGVVIFTDWNINTGYVIIVQHANNIVSIYKHNSSLLKKDGNFVRAGEPIAIIGDTGELTTGPHLHFELWHDGNPLNPEEFIVF